MLVHVGLLTGVIVLAHHPVAFLALFLMFLGYVHAYERHQDPLILKEALRVGFFLAGLVVLGGMQAWWLQPIVAGLEPLALFAGAGVALLKSGFADRSIGAGALLAGAILPTAVAAGAFLLL